MDKGWKATGLLTPLYEAHGGRDALAAKAKTSATTLSQINRGKRNLGLGLAQRIAEAAGISVLELGAPLEAADERSQTIFDRLEEVATHASADAVALRKDLRKAILRIRALEQQVPDGARRASETNG